MAIFPSGMWDSILRQGPTLAPALGDVTSQQSGQPPCSPGQAWQTLFLEPSLTRHHQGESSQSGSSPPPVPEPGVQRCLGGPVQEAADSKPLRALPTC